MKGQMKRTVYEAPLTELFQIELEGAFMAGSVVEGEHSVATSGHELNDINASNYVDANDIIHNWNDESNPWQ